jgi:hypothetical protein
MKATGVIDRAQMSKSGKTLRILIGDTWYSTDNFALQQAVGRPIEFNVGTSEYGGKTIYWANDAELAGNGGAPHTANPAAHAPRPPNAPSRSVPSGVPASELAARDFMPFTSNQVAHAIAAGLITSPDQLLAWTKAAFAAIKTVCDPATANIMSAPDPEFDDDIPF